MARVLLAWELGGGLGHARPLARLAGALLRGGHALDLAWKELAVARMVLGPLADHPRLRLWQAPVCLSTATGPPEPATHAELLLRSGYARPAELAGRVDAWRSLFGVCSPDLLVADHAPTALLAARGLPMRRALFGTGFFMPPARTPLPVYRDWEPVAPERVAAADARLREVCNAVLSGLGAPPFAAAHELFEADERFLLGWPALDHLLPWRPPGEAPPSWGRLGALGGGASPAWPEGDGPRLFGYLHAQHPAASAVLATLRAGPWRSLLFLAGVSAAAAAELGSPALRVSTDLIDLAQALAEASVLLGSASAGTLYAALAAGVPSVMLPMQAEQLLLAQRVVAHGAGVLLWPHEVQTGLARALAAVAGSPGFVRAARALAERGLAAVAADAARRPPLPAGPPLDDDPVAAAIAARCEALAGPPADAY